jgi:glycerol-3-phosphate dehydrogenase
MTGIPLTQVNPHYDVLIIGAGINGCGVFRDLCLQGVTCLLIDRGDICEGASAAPSRLIHGGIKYLETGEFRLVHESAVERNRLLRNAPHYVKPLETIVPVKSWFGGLLTSALRFCGVNGKLTDRGALITEIGLRIYDFYSRKVQALPNHRFLGPANIRAEYPAFAGDIKAAGLYYEGRITHAERLGLELVLDGLAANPQSALCTYTTVAQDTATSHLVLTDALAEATAAVSTKVIINAGGAWIDKVNAGLGIASQHTGGSKGSHLIVDNPALVVALKGRMIYFGTADGRVNLVYPFFGHALIGSTDIPIQDPDDAICTPEETDYLLKVVGEVFPAIAVTRDQVRLSYCGVRPLPRSSKADIGAVSRDHAIGRDEVPGKGTPVLSLIGGKWTTFRAFAEQASNVVLERLGRTRTASTEQLAIGGGRGFPVDDAGTAAIAAQIAAAAGVGAERAGALLQRYGTTARALATTLARQDDRPLASLPGYSAGEIIHICNTEKVRCLSDILLRRTAIAMEGLLTGAVVEEVAAIAAQAFGWPAQRKAAEIAAMHAEMKRRAVAAPPPVTIAA